jgi:hypothetical protein
MLENSVFDDNEVHQRSLAVESYGSCLINFDDYC